ncbi:hypothetical protein Afe04nite_75580 [Asanoa ferruginea]|nr:hypothetical protein Afe04nite_75580 [Asanoa ferruginea]
MGNGTGTTRRAPTSRRVVPESDRLGRGNRARTSGRHLHDAWSRALVDGWPDGNAAQRDVGANTSMAKPHVEREEFQAGLKHGGQPVG